MRRESCRMEGESVPLFSCFRDLIASASHSLPQTRTHTAASSLPSSPLLSFVLVYHLERHADQ